MMQENIFQKIIDKKIPANIVYEDDRCLAFRDVNPQAPSHVLIIPRKVIPTHADIREEDRELLGHLHLVAARLAVQLGISDGYRLIVRRDGATVRLYTRNAYDWTVRLPAIAAAAGRIKAKSFTIEVSDAMP